MNKILHILKTVLVMLSLSIMLFACATQKIIYIKVPEWKLTTGLLPQRMVLEDGTIIIHEPRILNEMIADGNGEISQNCLQSA